MAYKYEKSEIFRANIFLFTGYALCSPLSITSMEYLVHNNKVSFTDLAISVTLFIIGSLLVVRAYSLISEVEDKQDVNQ